MPCHAIVCVISQTDCECVCNPLAVCFLKQAVSASVIQCLPVPVVCVCVFVQADFNLMSSARVQARRSRMSQITLERYHASPGSTRGSGRQAAVSCSSVVCGCGVRERNVCGGRRSACGRGYGCGHFGGGRLRVRGPGCGSCRPVMLYLSVCTLWTFQ